jgi:uncharacterized protein YjbI with pentapeptide repeats
LTAKRGSGKILFKWGTKSMIDQKTLMDMINLGKSFEGIEIGDIEFRGQRLERQVIINGAKFKGNVDFTNTLFLKDVSFRNSKFFGKVYFDSAHFEDSADFAFTEFEDEASFSNKIRFAKHIGFGGAIFHKKVSFENALFQGETYFGYTRFVSEAIFSYARFFERTFFDGAEENRLFSDNHPMSMISVLFQKPQETHFRIVNLSRCLLTNTDLSSVELTDIKWAKRGLLDKRKAVYDEIAGDSRKNYPLIEKVYRQLKKNYENRGSYGDAGDFHYGEMEMRRLAHQGIFKYISLTALYKYLSGYGEKYWRAFFWLGIFFILFASSYLITGIKASSENANSSVVMIYNFTFQFSNLFTSSFWQDFSRSLLHAFEVATFQRNRMFMPVSTSGRFLEILQAIIISIQAAFTALALKRNFKR